MPARAFRNGGHAEKAPPVMAGFEEVRAARASVSARYVSGDGIEVGALHNSYPVTDRAKVTYVDRLTKAEALVSYPELLPQQDAIVDPDIIDDGETLGTLADESQDFVIASHFLEHCENPLSTMRNHVRVLRSGGRLLLVVPNAADPHGWDHARELTRFEHLVRDDREGPQVSREAHYAEWVTLVDKRTGEHARQEQRRLMAVRHSIHFHCWTAATFLPFLVEAIAYNSLDAFVTYSECWPSEMIAVLQRGAGAAAQADAEALGPRLVACDAGVIAALGADRDRLLVELAALRGTATVRLREWLLRSPVLGRPTRFVARLAKGRVYS